MGNKIFIKISDIPDFYYINVTNKTVLTHVEKYYGKDDINYHLFVYSELEKLLKMKFNDTLDMLFFLNTGKPCIRNGYVSVSHSGTVYGVGCSKSEFGIDVEQIKNVNYKVAKKLYKEKDVSKISKEEFYLRWTFMEAKAKMNNSSIFDLNDNGVYSHSEIITIKNKQYALSVAYKDKDAIIVK